MDYREFKTLTKDVVVENGISESIINDFIKTSERLQLEQGLRNFYPQGLFVYGNLVLYFIYDDKIIKVDFNDGYFKLSTYNINNIEKLTLEMKAGSDLERGLSIAFQGIEDYIFLESISDTNSAWAYKFAKTIEEIYILLKTAS
ncbi:Protein of unknown function [Salinibacillus kushneri]|uniref:Uncharacterized protein n=1 Tax=Salinibacillus kushneri TaxID=237682 RepID=A0A1I0B4Q0_9BACI|nr:DUF3908 family protein [Salinibacillus kushneri]SET01754.1 Protein of unknown function [Salinibacillus kushneri]